MRDMTGRLLAALAAVPLVLGAVIVAATGLGIQHSWLTLDEAADGFRPAPSAAGPAAAGGR
ncbi:hypothetical protein HMPREF9719_01277, partial [Corynebacterium otitidis ATCC 51513]